MPAFMRCAYRCDKEPTNWKGDESREKLAQVNIEDSLTNSDTSRQHHSYYYYKLTTGTEGASSGHS